MRKPALLLLAAALSAPAGLAFGQARPVPAQTGTPTPVAEVPRPRLDPEKPSDETLSTTPHAVRVDGVEVKYTATAGTLLLRDEAGKPKAQVFFVAYTRDDVADRRRRPLTFAYNGGPGSASVWLHMGALGPKRVQMADDGFQPAPPFALVDNDSSIIDVSDLVMIDAISTGYSRPLPGEDTKQFHGVREDLRWFAEFIRRYVTRFDRWASPKFLLGESYGTFRSAGLAQELQQRHGVELNGIVLVSTVLDFATIRFDAGDLPYITNLPTYTAIAHYHRRLAGDLQGDLTRALDEAREFAGGEYTTALLKGNRLTPDERAAVAKKLARLTGVGSGFVERANLRVTPERFRKELLRDRRLTVGRLDGRFTALDADAAGESPEFDPSNTALQGAYTALFVDYVRRQLKYESDQQYFTSGQVQPWSLGEGWRLLTSTTEMLRSAMARNPFLRVLVVNGYYDLATPFFGAELTFDHLGWEPTYRERTSWTYYEGGHMMYIRVPMLQKLKQDVAAFIRAASGQGAAVQ